MAIFARCCTRPHGIPDSVVWRSSSTMVGLPAMLLCSGRFDAGRARRCAIVAEAVKQRGEHQADAALFGGAVLSPNFPPVFATTAASSGHQVCSPSMYFLPLLPVRIDRQAVHTGRASPPRPADYPLREPMNITVNFARAGREKIDFAILRRLTILIH